MGAALAAALVAASIAAGIPERIGIPAWSRDAHVSFGALLAIAGSLFGGAVALSALRHHEPARKAAMTRVVAAAGCGLFAALMWQGDSVTPPRPFEPIRLDEVALASTVAFVLLLLAWSCSRLGNRRGDAAARAVGTTTIVYLALMAVNGIARDVGWYGELSRSERMTRALGALVVCMIGMTVLLGVIACLRVKERMRLGSAARRAQWAESVVAASTRQAAQLVGAHHQFLGSAAALARLVWSPFGEHDDAGAQPVVNLEALSPARSMRIVKFDLSERARQAVLSRIRHDLAQPGWLQQQYERAVSFFRGHLAFESGRDVADLAHVRPEHDPSTELPTEEPEAPEGTRWSFARRLSDGSLDLELRRATADDIGGDIFNKYFEIADPTAPADSHLDTVRTSARSLAEGQAPLLPASTFHRLSLPIADDPRARFRTDIWWPSIVPAPEDVAVHSHMHDAHAVGVAPAGVVVPFVRSDWSMPFAASVLPLCEASPAVPVVPFVPRNAPFDEVAM
jgi:hypothetical protein